VSEPIVLPCGVKASVTRAPKVGVRVFVRTEREILHSDWFGSVEAAAADLNSRIRAMYAAILPAGSVVVRVDDEATAAKIADALAIGVMEAQSMEAMARNRERRLRQARDVLAALAEPKP